METVRHGRYMAVLLLLLAVGTLLTGCVIRQGREKIADLEYTVLRPAEIPETLAAQIEAKKEADFTLTYSDNEFLYIARGYGEQETGGYSIQVKACYLAKNALCVSTVLTGPTPGEQVSTAPSYPYLVLKTELREEQVVFD